MKNQIMESIINSLQDSAKATVLVTVKSGAQVWMTPDQAVQYEADRIKSKNPKS